ncbi:hypothetical protein BKA62DRAFT_826285 [Auriculariales sp. MPI-PUGE-AT-0066]|nr:hypothetical protein BKA62DRAFT_826285 [Auriculariales sp. MPI-PUGE-AT-0066]
MSSEIVNVFVAFLLIYLVVRWFSKGGAPAPANSPAALLGFNPRKVTDEMITTVHAAFPDIPRANIHYDLLRTGSAELTSNKILERGLLDAPPPSYFRAFPLQPQPVPTPVPASSSSTPTPAPKDLISRFQLESRVSDEVVPVSAAAPALASAAGGKAGWDAAPDRREANLRERKAQMILEARKRMAEKLAQQQTETSP